MIRNKLSLLHQLKHKFGKNIEIKTEWRGSEKWNVAYCFECQEIIEEEHEINQSIRHNTFKQKSLIICLALSTITLQSGSTEARCNNCSYNYNVGTAIGLGIAGGIIGSLLAPPPAQPTIIVVPTPYVQPVQPYTASLPSLPTLPSQQTPYWWCSASGRWYPDVTTCNVAWSHR